MRWGSNTSNTFTTSVAQPVTSALTWWVVIATSNRRNAVSIDEDSNIVNVVCLVTSAALSVHFFCHC